MKQQQFFYSKWDALYPFIYFAFMFLVQLLNKRFWVASRFSDPWIIASLAFVLVMLTHSFVKYFIPMLLGKTFLELDDEKLFIRPKNKVIYWADVEQITFADISSRAILKLYDKKKIRIYLKRIKGEDDFIYKTILEYYNAANHSTAGNDGKASPNAPVVV